MTRFPQDWSHFLEPEFDQAYMQALMAYLQEREAQGQIIYPPQTAWFNAFKETPLKKVKVVILGQDPYHGEGQAHGLSFSVQPGVKTPPSLMNMYKELEADLSIPVAPHGYLQSWAEQGVLLLNSVLTVEAGKAGAHQKKGWERFTDRVIEVISQENDGVVFLLWGSYAHKKGRNIDRDKHLVLEGVHPSPLSAYRGFFGCGHFSKANDYLLAQGKTAIDWSSHLSFSPPQETKKSAQGTLF